MKKTYQVRITDQAQEQMREIAHYIANELKAADAALRLLDTLETAILALANFPQKVALTDEEPWHSQGVHRLPVQNYLVYFWVDEEAQRVQVIAVIITNGIKCSNYPT